VDRHVVPCGLRGAAAADGVAVRPARPARPLLITSCIGYAVLGHPFFLMAASGSIELAVVAQLLMVLLYVPYAGACPAFYAEIFPTRVRYTALSIGYNIAVAIFGGFAPFTATFLVRVTDNRHAPAPMSSSPQSSLSSSYCGPAKLRLCRCDDRLDIEDVISHRSFQLERPRSIARRRCPPFSEKLVSAMTHCSGIPALRSPAK
jgi:hypothetical protein